MRFKRTACFLFWFFQLYGILANDNKIYQYIKPQHIPEQHLKEFSSLQVQDFQGRIKPIHTLALEILRKLYKKQTFEFEGRQGAKRKLSAQQVFLSMNVYPEIWQQIPLVYVEPHLKDALKDKINISPEGYAQPIAFFDLKGDYLLRAQVKEAMEKSPGKRDEFDKEILKLDERVNIVWGVCNGFFLKIFPVKNDVLNRWVNASDSSIADAYPASLWAGYAALVRKSENGSQWQKASAMLHAIKKYQQQHSKILLSEVKVAAEIKYNEIQIFFICLILYTVFGALLLANNFLVIFFPVNAFYRLQQILVVLLFLVFIFHGCGITLRWFITSHAPWSNGYEATVFIAFVGILASLFYIKKSAFPLAAMSLIATCLLGIAHGSLMNPEITPLVPVLKSYWLMIHVAVIMGGYGFLTLGSILALIVFLLFVFMNQQQQSKVWKHVHQLTSINQITTTLGLYMLAIGTFLGGVWANESWGRYWGWDPKETWALISIVVYAFVAHIRIMMPANSLFIYNTFSLFALSSLIMTFFGVNYYLSGLHSYAKGDAVPIPIWVYMSLPILLALVALSFRKYKKYRYEAG